MTIQEAIKRLEKVLESNPKGYYYDIQYWLYDDCLRAIGIKRRESTKAIRFYNGFDEDFNLGEEKGIIKADGEFYYYRFSVDDLLANDWECVIMDFDCSGFESFNDYLRDNNDEVVYLSDIEDLCFFSTLKERIKRIEVADPYSDKQYTDIANEIKEKHNKGEIAEVYMRNIIAKNGDLLVSLDWEAEV